MLKHDGVMMLVEAIHASPESQFTVSKFSTLGMINTLQNNLMVTETGKDTGVLSLTFTGEDREQIRQILDSITRNYLQQNVERKSEEAAKSLAFLAKQLPEVRNRLDVAENKLNAFRQDKDSVDLPLEAKAVLDSMVNIDAQLNELTFKEAEISKLFTKAHPAYRTLLEKRQALEDEKSKLNGRVTAMPKTQQEIVRLTRDVESGQQVYYAAAEQATGAEDYRGQYGRRCAHRRSRDCPARRTEAENDADYSRQHHSWFDAFSGGRTAAFPV